MRLRKRNGLWYSSRNLHWRLVVSRLLRQLRGCGRGRVPESGGIALYIAVVKNILHLRQITCQQESTAMIP